MSHAAVDSVVLFWSVVALMLVLLVLIVVAVWTHPEAVDSPEQHELHLRVPQPRPESLPPARRPPAVVLADTAVRSGDTGYRPSHTSALDPELTAIRRPAAVGRPPWSPAPRPPGLGDGDAAQPFAVPGQVPAGPAAYRVLPPGTSLPPHTGGTLGPEWTSPNPAPLRSALIVQGRAGSGGRAGGHRRAEMHQAGAHRRRSCRGAHRAGRSSGRAAGSGSRAGKHRAEVR